MSASNLIGMFEEKLFPKSRACANLSDFQVHGANVDLSGGSHGTINLDGRLDANLSGGSRLQYIGEPTMGDVTTSEGSTISLK